MENLMDFRTWMATEAGIEDMLNGHGMILFFRRGDDLFGAPEDSRLVFANLKANTPDLAGAKFPAFNLLQSLAGDPVQSLFGADDLPKIQVVARDHVVKKLHKSEKKKKK